MSGHSCDPVELYLRKEEMDQIWATGYSVPTPDLVGYMYLSAYVVFIIPIYMSL